MSVIYGVSPVLEALRSGRRRVREVLVARGGKPNRLDELRALTRQAGVPLVEVDRVRLDTVTHRANHQGVAAFVAPVEYADLEDVLASATDKPLFVVLDQVEDPHNLGAVIRTAECAGARAVIIPEHHAAGLTDTVVKASAGATEYLPVARVVNLATALDALRRRDIWIVGVERDGERPYTAWDFTLPTAIVLGSEGKGMRRLVRERCDLVVSLPLLGQITSLNVSVAAGVVLYEAVRQRHLAPA
ncbi:MAG: 23S rRNA (guanosine(2251)-2'-O)-methyltransferase RlmB [Chloracidobacterium sp.]|uniref:23S rRNA (Guanosine(2251)-2'-O)-methyltransferase RlmB n=1 Tax=Chloracidobacterium validum TaxID=2821543 RepID=A0ABX8BAY8_9BACT|nr:23S rRNA (guanosine(2251)-2'-O)-methyltransferase RlmB [Chloracidobacterium validum]QUW02235.1 23S rRNA (guanosine(2251)-2'-O)-methyltransferase RlmB [Chloracidobacterium validum]